MQQENESSTDNDNDDELSVASDDISFDIPIPQAEEATLSWRNDPSYNFSDWKLQVIIRENPEENTDTNVDRRGDNTSVLFQEKIYNVHRNILAIGERRSGYFANLLHYRIDDGNQCSRIELSSRAAAHFPDLLDYIYSSRAFAIRTRNAIALLFLAQAFQVVSLEVEVKSFIDKDIQLFNFGYYLSDALYFSEETVALKAIHTCEEGVMSLLNRNNNAEASIDLGLYKIIKVPLLSSLQGAEKNAKPYGHFCRENSILPVLHSRKTF
eukprot:jgi/Psemu1/326626/estExt_fgenesh1_pg.C_4300005